MNIENLRKVGGQWYAEMLGQLVLIQSLSDDGAEQLRRGTATHQRRLRASVKRGDWRSASALVGSGARPGLLRHLWPRIPEFEKAAALADAISAGDAPNQERAFLLGAVRELSAAGVRVYDGDAAHAAFDALPENVTIYRGTVEAEGDNYGICWTLDRERAVFFAAEHGRFRRTDSPPVVLRAVVRRDDLSGVFLERDESEVLVLPERVGQITATSPSPNPAR
jgi:hypothetical protein